MIRGGGGGGGEISNELPNGFFGTNVYNILEFC